MQRGIPSHAAFVRLHQLLIMAIIAGMQAPNRGNRRRFDKLTRLYDRWAGSFPGGHPKTSTELLPAVSGPLLAAAEAEEERRIRRINSVHGFGGEAQPGMAHEVKDAQ